MPSDEENQAAGDAAIDEAIEASNQGRAASQAEGLPSVSPDVVEQEIGGQMDNIVPTRGYTLTPTVGLGGSAGSIQALGAFFEAMPADSGLVFVVVLHLSPEHESTLAELLGRHTSMPVVQAQDGVVVKADHVYVIPPGRHLASVDGHLKLSPLESEHGKRVAVDVFFRTLADTHGAHSAAIVLSGADGDGAIGLKRIKERGGLTVAQDPGEAEHEGMPRSAVATGMVDWVLKVQEMPARLLEYFAREKRVLLPLEDEPEPANTAPPAPDAQESTLRELLAFLHTRTGRDFSCYKRATVLRRISRRMQINAAESLAEYLVFLRTHPGESGALLQDLLISVTNFFRDREAFAALEAHIPQLFRDKRPGDTVRVWVAACATGEEAYSVAMLLFEHARKLEAPPRVQVFATDLAEEVVHSARDGVYPTTITADVSEERLARFFTREHRGYRVRRELREAVLFAQHDLLKDSPFSKLDLVTCRNLLIYLNHDAQRRALDIFHFALVRHGLLFLGTSEGVDDAGELFAPLNKKLRLYVAQPSARVGLPVPVGTSTLTRALREREQAAERPVLPEARPLDATLPDLDSLPGKKPSHELQLRILAQAGPPTVIVDARHQIVHLSGAASRYLQFDAGEFTPDLLAVIHPMLRTGLRAALARAAETHQPAEIREISVDLDGQRQAVDLRVTPGQYAAAGYLVVTFHTVAANLPAGESLSAPSLDDTVTRQLEHQLEESRRHLRDAEEEHEVTLEEHKASHEELQASNEELKSASEELETSREELQAINEELTTVNQELKARVDELGHANSDLHNLMAATNIATVFLDRELRIARYTPSAVALFNLIPTDVGRPLTDLKHRLDYPEMEQDARQVLARLVHTEREVHHPGDGWFQARLQPYRSLDDHIAGVVLTFVDVTERRRAEEALRESERRLRRMVNVPRVGVLTFDFAGRLLDANDAFLEMAGYTRAEFAARSFGWLDFTPPEYVEPSRVQFESVRQTGIAGPYEKEYFRQDGSRVWMMFVAADLGDGTIIEYAVDVSDRRRAEAALRESEEKYRTLFESIDEGFAIIDLILDENGRPVDTLHLEANPAYERHTGLHGIVGKRGLEVMPEIGAWLEFYGNVARTGQAVRAEYHVEPLGRWLAAYVSRVGGEGSMRLAVVFADITERKRRETHQNLLVKIGDDLSRLVMPDEIMRAVSVRLGEYLNLGICVFVDVDEVRSEATVQHGWTREGVTSLEHQAFRMSDYTTPEFQRASRAAEFFIIRDTAEDERVDAEAYARLNVGAWFSVPFHREGRWTAFLAVTDTAPRDWRDDEIELVHNIADRVFPRIERARAEEISRASEARFRAVANVVPDLLWSSEPDGLTTWYSDRWLEYTGLTLAQATGSGWVQAIHPEDRENAERSYREAIRSGIHLEHEQRIRRADGHYRSFLVRAEPLRDERGAVMRWLGSATDIDDLVRARAEAEAAGRAKDHFLAVLSHELRTPLMPISIALATLNRRQDLPEIVRKAHEMIKRNVELEAHFIDDLLDMTRISRGKMEIARESIDLHEAAERAVEVSSADIEAKSQRLVVSLEAGEHGLQGDFSRLQQVFWNLLKNASKFTPKGGEIYLRTRNEPGRIVVEVTDTGIGLEADALARVFQPFEQASTAITREFGGLGLGLAIAKGTVEAHGGTLSVTSPGSGQGATFIVSLPLL